jgi:hypothetical protein
MIGGQFGILPCVGQGGAEHDDQMLQLSVPSSPAAEISTTIGPASVVLKNAIKQTASGLGVSVRPNADIAKATRMTQLGHVASEPGRIAGAWPSALRRRAWGPLLCASLMLVWKEWRALFTKHRLGAA